MARTYGEQLRLIRRYTGDAFTSKRGYDARKEPSFGQRMAVLKYARKVEELLSEPVQTYKPPKGYKREIFEQTGQVGYSKFNVALVKTPNTPANVRFILDKTRPRGSRLVAEDKKTRQHYYEIPPELFLKSEEIDTDFYREVLEEYAADATYFMIRAGESYIWGAATNGGGSLDGVTKKIGEIFRNYSAAMFDANNKNSHYVGNWFRGVTAFTSFKTAQPLLAKGLEQQAAHRKRYGKKKWRLLEDKTGTTRRYENGRLANGWKQLKGSLWGYYVDGVMIDKQYR